MGELKAKEYKKFEDIKHIREDGSEYWYARELAEVLDYTQWRNFTKVMDKAMIACSNSCREVVYDFAEVSKIVDAGATSKPVKDYELTTRYACYLIVLNGGTMPEDLPTPEKSIAQIEKERIAELKRRAKKKPLMLDE